MYIDKNEENLISSKKDNMFNNFNDKKNINHLCLNVNDEVGDSNSSDGDNDGNISEEKKRRKKGMKF